MGNPDSFKHFLELILELIIPPILMIFGYIYHPIELIEKYKYAMPNEIGLLMLSTGILIYLAYITCIKYREHISSKCLAILLLLNILSISFFIYTVHALQMAFISRNDPEFDYIFKSYMGYVIIYAFLVFLLSYSISYISKLISLFKNLLSQDKQEKI